MTVLLGAIAIAIVGSITGILLGKLKNYLTAKEEAKWDVDLFPLPEIHPELYDYAITRSITVSTGYLTFKWVTDAHSITRTRHFKNVEEAVANYKDIFAKHEEHFYQQTKGTLTVVASNRDLIDKLTLTLKEVEYKAYRTEKALNQLKESLGETHE